MTVLLAATFTGVDVRKAAMRPKAKRSSGASEIRAGFLNGDGMFERGDGEPASVVRPQDHVVAG